MSLESGLVALITGDAGVSALMSTRLYPDVIPQDVTMPAGHYRLTVNRVAMAHDNPAGVEFSTVRVTIFDTLRASVITLRDIIKTAVSGYKGTSGGETFDAVFYQEGANSFDVESGLYSAAFDLRVTRRVS